MKKLLSLIALASLAATSNVSTMAMLLMYDSDVTPWEKLSPADQKAAIPACKILENYRRHPNQKPDTQKLNSALSQLSGRMSGNAHHARLFARKLSQGNGKYPKADSQRVTNALVELCPESALVKEMPMKRAKKR